MLLYSEARGEAERLSRTLNRNVEVASVNCDCDYSKLCYLCGGEGRYYTLVFASCNHNVDDLDSCAENDCAERERLSRIMSKTDHLDPFPVQHPPLKSCREVQSERESEVLV